MLEDPVKVAVALRYLEIYVSGTELERMHEIFEDDLIFAGPLFHFESAQDYVDSLVSNPPVGCNINILHAYEDASSVNLIYEFSKTESDFVLMSQWFEIVEQKISRIVLIFDTGNLVVEPD